ncbi:uncharacterized protein LOC118227386 [Anguilla anguilla]|uniref:uncharacterized protein LOC118227386 n=1 Tax=Anguilla anguilla TaxID=7936 RepID=UPI0015A77348|nr:uncharacterized protein LOC118227386 [Anguilla anguilla]
MAVSADLAFLPPPRNCKRVIHFRNIKSVDTVQFAQHLQTTASPPIGLSAEESVSHYNELLGNTLNQFAPLKSRTVSFSRSAPWYTPELRKMKSAGRKLERLCRSTCLPVHKIAFHEHQRAYSLALKNTRSSFLSNLIDRDAGNPRHLFSTINHLLKPASQSPIEASESQCNNFIKFFKNKINNIRALISSSPVLSSPLPTPPPPSTSSTFTSFSDITPHDIEEIITKMKPSTCPLDPIPTTLLKTSIAALCPLIASLINISLCNGSVPSSLKTAVITPLLKKPSLDPEVLLNYRPISNLPFLSKVLEKVVAAQLQLHLTSNSLYCGRRQGEVRGVVIEGRYVAARWLHPRALYGLPGPTRQAWA